ncbi:MAG: hypothetical protein COA57_13090 [Flavobacteriales bacterium]|nr:MAG: hypothetical protein COA57_13090 [Flavobacteriales bacterium]
MKRQEKAYYHNSFSTVIESKSYDVPIYRYIPFDYLLHLLRTHYLWVGPTKLWDDTYENFLTKAKFQWDSTPISYLGFLPGFYGQCWTLQKETDALWRIYSHDKKGVRIKSRINKVLGASINEANLKPLSTRIRIIGQIKYLSKNQIKKWIEKQNEKIINDKTLVESLFIKRKEFVHEKEVRLIIHKNIDEEEESKGIEHNHIKLAIEPNELIEEITFDPRLRNEDFKTYKQVVQKMNYTNKITKSKLYEFERPTIKNSQPPTMGIGHSRTKPTQKPSYAPPGTLPHI